MNMTKFKSFIVVTLLLVTAAFAQANAEVPAEVTLIKNVNVWDGRSDSLKEGYDVLIVRNLIRKVAKDIPTSGTYEIDETSGNV
jgi:hypothetical protein